MSSTPWMYMAAGAVLISLVYGLLLLIRASVFFTKALLKRLDELTAAATVGKELIASQNQTTAATVKLQETAHMVALELQMLRSIFQQQSPNFGQEPDGGVTITPRKPVPPYPGVMMENFVEVPDAKEEDVEVMDTTDAEYVELERIEELREQGIEVETEPPSGVLRQAEG